VVSDFVTLPGGKFLMGSEAFYPEEGPVHETFVESFEISRHAVTNAQFADFVEQTGYITVAERPVDPSDLGASAHSSIDPGSLVFTPTDNAVDLANWRLWWKWVPGASWRHPRGPGSDIATLLSHPVVQVSYEDANAFASWAGARLPTEEEWEFAARGGLESATFAWGEEPNNGSRANTWQGSFPFDNQGAKGWVYTAPVGSFPPNGYGLYEMTGNTWEWTSSLWRSRHRPANSCCPAPPEAEGHSPGRSRVLKGGSHLCSPSYCLRYRPAARSQQTEDSATTHIGFRLARSLFGRQL
jgi:formylglycine-generating enzyme